MQLTLCGIQDQESFRKAGIVLPSYDIREIREKAVKAPRWVHFGIGNIFRIFLGGIADELLEKGLLDRGITCLETFDEEVADRIYRPYDNLALSVILRSDGKREIRVLGSLAEAVKASDRNRVKEIFESPDLQIVSYTITEKGYALKGADGSWLPYVKADLEKGPSEASGAMGITAAGLYARFLAGQLPTALVSMDNCSKNGRLLRDAVRTVSEEWYARGFVPEAFLHYVGDEAKVAFDSTMIDKITPRPGQGIAADLEALGLQDMQPVITEKRTYIAPFANGEKPQYLVIEDRFPNGRPALEEAYGVYLGDFDTVNRAERMKVTALLNPVHSAAGPLGVVLGEEFFADMLEHLPVMLKMAKQVAYDEGMPAAEDPGIISPKAFADELFQDRFPNRYLGDTNLRLATDVSQGVGVRFGETVKAYVKREGTAAGLTAIPLGIAGWLRYMLGIDDRGEHYELAPDPMNEEITALFGTVEWGRPESLKDQLRGILSNERVFGTDLYQAGIGKKIEEMFREMIAGPGSALKTVEKYIG